MTRTKKKITTKTEPTKSEPVHLVAAIKDRRVIWNWDLMSGIFFGSIITIFVIDAKVPVWTWVGLITIGLIWAGLEYWLETLRVKMLNKIFKEYMDSYGTETK